MRNKTKDKLTPLSLEPAPGPAVVAADEALFTPVESSKAAVVEPAVPEARPDPPEIVAERLFSVAPLADMPGVGFEKPPHTAQSPVEAAPIAVAAPSTPVASPAKKASPPPLPLWARSAYWVALPAAVIWAGCMAAFASGYRQPFGAFEYRPYPLFAFAGLCLLPAVFILLAAYAVRQAAKLSAEMRKARELAADIAIPAALAADQAGGAAAAVRREVERAAAAALAAEQQLLDLRRALAEESDRLIEATGDAERKAQTLAETLSRERIEMDALAITLNTQAETAAAVIVSGSRTVSEASDLAAMQLQEAEAALALRATDLAAAAGEAGEAAQLVGEALAGHAERLEAAGEDVAARVQGLSGAFSAEQARLSTLADRLRADQEHIAARIAAQRDNLLSASADARAGADEMAEASEQSAGALRALIADVADQVGRIAHLAETDQADLAAKADQHLKLFTGLVADERAAMEAETRKALDALTAAAAETRTAALAHGEATKAEVEALGAQANDAMAQIADAASKERARLQAETQSALDAMHTATGETRKAAEAQAEAAKTRVEELGQAAFAAGQKADQAFDARLGVARRMIEQSAEMVEQAGQRSAERIEHGLVATKGALGDLQQLLADIDARVSALPADARARAESVRDAVEQGIGELTAAARKAAEETQAIDAAFQGRIKHNYEMLSEALRLMSKVSGAAEGVAKAPAPAAATPRLAPPAALAEFRPILPETDRSIRVPVEAVPSPPRETSPVDLGLRPRLRLTPATAAPMVRPVARPDPQPAPVPRPAAPMDDGQWTWKDLLSSIDAPPMDDEVLADRLIAEIEALGLDAPGLLPLNRIDEIAAVLQAGDVDGAREVVRNLAPSAVRRLSRRVLTDKVLHAHADRYLQRYETLLADSAKRDRDGFVTAALLGSDPGRAFLLFNAAVGELH